MTKIKLKAFSPWFLLPTLNFPPNSSASFPLSSSDGWGTGVCVKANTSCLLLLSPHVFPPFHQQAPFMTLSLLQASPMGVLPTGPSSSRTAPAWSISIGYIPLGAGCSSVGSQRARVSARKPVLCGLPSPGTALPAACSCMDSPRVQLPSGRSPFSSVRSSRDTPVLHWAPHGRMELELTLFPISQGSPWCLLRDAACAAPSSAPKTLPCKPNSGLLGIGRFWSRGNPQTLWLVL